MPATLLLLVFAVGYGLCMKIADLYNEHGLKGWRYSGLLFGLAFGIFGALLIWYGGRSTANILVAMILAMIPRNRIDRLNHQLAIVIMFITFLFLSSIRPEVFHPWVFTLFFLVIWIFGAIKDRAADRYKEGTSRYWIAESMLYYPLPSLLFSISTGEWIVFWVFFFYTVAYNFIKVQARRRGYV